MIDLHIHTTASDGQYSPTELIQKAASKKITTLAITDHDTVAGLEEGKLAAKQEGINFVPGVELNIQHFGGEFHLLGLGFTSISDSLKEVLTDLQKKGVVKTRQQAFDRFLAKGRPCYVERVGANLDQAIIAIQESGGAPVIAHPMSLFMSWGKLPDFLQNIYERGVVGLEAFHPGARVTECLRLDELAKKIGFFITAGSDFHGEKIRADRKIGYTCGKKKIEDSIYENGLLKWQQAQV